MSRSRKTATQGFEDRTHQKDAGRFTIGVVGLGLMGTSIATCLLAAGHPVVSVDRDPSKRSRARRRILAYLNEMRAEGLVKGDPRRRLFYFTVAKEYAALAGSQLVVEAIVEDLKAKRECLGQIERYVSRDTVIGSNTSAIPPSLLQQGSEYPDRILGVHWAEPAHTTRFMEIICGNRTDEKFAERARKLAQGWGKEPSVLRRDIRGFITNRCMYALMREAFHLVEAGYATIEDVDRSIRNDFGYWITFAGPFRFMDLTGIPAYAAVMRDLFPELNCSKEVPDLMRQMVDSGAQGVSNAKGFYRYSPAQARRWEKLFMRFSYEIRALAEKYPADAGDRRRQRR
jgi:3-hydroxybutyryl-CoA dehydrogenase